MCGFLAFKSKDYDEDKIKLSASRIQYRGPDNTSYLFSDNHGMVFHRLAIVDTSEKGNQPLIHPQEEDISLVCNGEIYNHKQLIRDNSFKISSESDCEVILHMYKDFGIEKTVKSLDGVFAFALYDARINTLFVARDPYGVRPLFVGKNKKGESIFASEAKALVDLCEGIKQFDPGMFWTSAQPTKFKRYYSTRFNTKKHTDEAIILKNINSSLSNAVEKRLMSDRELGCLLSGGLDSSLISALAIELSGKKLNTFSIGMEGSPDLFYADRVAKHIGSKHHSVKLSTKEFLDTIPEVIEKIESYDTTTVRASVGNYLISKYIKENTDCKVIFNGDGADEVCMGYAYNKNAPSEPEFLNENIKLLREIHLFDVLRSDRSISSNGLEARTPFLDLDFVKMYLAIDTRFKMFGENGLPEKFLLRKAFDRTGLLPDSILWRNKCAFSDGVSHVLTSWHETIKEFIDLKITDNDFKSQQSSITHCKPLLKESLYYRNIFEDIFGKENETLVPHFWMPNWTDAIDPSARVLDGHKED
tara:strand:+ start:8913 stop:10505 length:1593 start_codon:yes stop_codon:yes gene_type:complete